VRNRWKKKRMGVEKNYTFSIRYKKGRQLRNKYIRGRELETKQRNSEILGSVQTRLPLCLARLSISPLRLALPISRSLSRLLQLQSPASPLLLPSSTKAEHVSPPSVRVDLFPNLALSGCVVVAGCRRCPCRWRLGAGARGASGHPQPSQGAPTKRARCWWCSHDAGSHPDDRNRPASFSPYIANVCFSCRRCFRGMLQVFRIDVAKVDRDIAYVAMAIHICCKRLFQMFHLFF
jgi:hypothetical protein